MYAADRPNFTGRWRLDEAQSTRGAPHEMTQVVDHREPVMRIDTDWDKNQATGVSNAAILAPTLQLTSDNAENVNAMPLGLSLTTKSHWDGDAFITEWRLNGLQTRLSGNWRRYLSGPTNMVVDSIADGSSGRVTARFVFLK